MNKPVLLLLLLTLGLGSVTTLADSVGTISTLTGKVYRRCQIVKVHPDGVSFTHANGAAKVLFTDLPRAWRVKLGYNQAKAEAYERELAARREREIEARAARQAELGRALLLAQEMELNRLRLAQQQAVAMVQIVSASNGGFGYSYPILPTLGAVWDGRSFRHRYRGGHGVWNNDGQWCQPIWGHPFGTFGTFGTTHFGSGFGHSGFGAPACHVGTKGSFTFQTKP